MTVASILRLKGNSVYTVGSGQMLADAAKLLSERKIGAVVVVDEGAGVQGVLGEREIVAAISKGGAAALTRPVSEFMNRKFMTCRRSDSVEHLMALMTSTRHRHIPIVEEGRLAGIVSIGDVVKRRIEESEHEAQVLREYITAH